MGIYFICATQMLNTSNDRFRHVGVLSDDMSERKAKRGQACQLQKTPQESGA